MAGFCAKCGVPLESSTGFCPSCGASAVAKKKTSTLKIVLIVVAVVVVLGILGVGTLGFVGWRAMHSNGNGMTMGQAANVSDAELGVSIYPGAVRVENGSARVKVFGMETESASYTTSDPLSSVVSYYQDKLNNYQDKLGTNAVTTSQRNGATILSLAGINGNAKETLVVTLKPSVLAAGQTEITITHVKIAAQ